MQSIGLFTMMFLLAWLATAVGFGLVVVPVFGASISGVLLWTGIPSFIWAVCITIQNKE